jgi:hypothetical protein
MTDTNGTGEAHPLDISTGPHANELRRVLGSLYTYLSPDGLDEAIKEKIDVDAKRVKAIKAGIKADKERDNSEADSVEAHWTQQNIDDGVAVYPTRITVLDLCARTGPDANTPSDPDQVHDLLMELEELGFAKQTDGYWSQTEAGLEALQT